MKTWILLPVLLTLLTSLIHQSRGSAILFEGNPQEVKNGLTTALKLRCSLNDTAASSSIIGRRDVTRTDDDVAEVSSIVIMKAGNDVALLSHNIPAHLVNASFTAAVTGSISGRTGFMELTIPNPTKSEVGEFVCEINTIRSGHVVTFSNSVEVTTVEPSIADLVQAIRDLRTNEEILKATIAEMNTTVFFSVGLTHSSTFTHDQVVTYDRVFSNVGGDYDPSTGLFTCDVPGYYEFSISALAPAGKKFDLDLYTNGDTSISIYGNGETFHQGSSDSVIIPLVKGDVVKVVSFQTSDLLIYGTQSYATFNGKLVQRS